MNEKEASKISQDSEIKMLLDAAKHYDTQMWAIPPITFSVIYFVFKESSNLFVSIFGFFAIFILLIIFAKGRSYQLAISQKLSDLTGDENKKKLDLWNLYCNFEGFHPTKSALLNFFRSFTASKFYIRLMVAIMVLFVFKWIICLAFLSPIFSV